MEAEAMKLVEWQRRYGTEAACAAALAERLRQLIGVSWVTASRMLRKLRTAMGVADLAVWRCPSLLARRAAA